MRLSLRLATDQTSGAIREDYFWKAPRSTTTTRSPALSVAFQALDLVLPALRGEALREFNEAALDGQAFAVEQGKEDRRGDPEHEQQISKSRSWHAKSVHEP